VLKQHVGLVEGYFNPHSSTSIILEKRWGPLSQSYHHRKNQHAWQ